MCYTSHSNCPAKEVFNTVKVVCLNGFPFCSELLSVNIENSPSKLKFRNTSFSVRKNPLVKHFRKSQSKFPKNFHFRENRQKVKCCPTPYSRRSKTFWIIPFSKPSGRMDQQKIGAKKRCGKDVRMFFCLIYFFAPFSIFYIPHNYVIP